MPFGHYFWVIWGLASGGSLLYLVYRLRASLKRGALFPPAGETQILYEEKTASGCSLENILTRLGGASNCLTLVVTAEELWTRAPFPLNLFTEIYDLEHRIRKRDILSVQEVERFLTGRAVVVEYRREDGRTARMELLPKRYEQFKEALGVEMIAGNQVKTSGGVDGR